MPLHNEKKIKNHFEDAKYQFDTIVEISQK